MIESLDAPTLLKGFVGLFGSGGIGALLVGWLRRGKSRTDVRDARNDADVVSAEAERERSDAHMMVALNGVAERWVDRAERKLQEAEDTIGRLRLEIHALRNELTKYNGLEVENERLRFENQRLTLELAASKVSV